MSTIRKNMEFETFRIDVPDKPVLAFKPGETIDGILHVELAPSKKGNVCKGIKITCKGEAKVAWSDSKSNYSAAEKYFEEEVYVLGTGAADITIPPGRQYYSFKFVLPTNIPGSFNDENGQVLYTLQAEVVTGISSESNQKVQVLFSVNGILDLNTEPLARVSSSNSHSVTSCFWCCKSGPIGYALKLGVRGFLAGGFIRFTGEYSNNTSKSVRPIAYLIQEATFKAPNKTLTTEKIICEAKGPEVGPDDTQTWSGNVLEVPDIQPTALGKNCKIIDVQYILKIEYHSRSLTISMPIVIGTLPFRATWDSFKEVSSTRPASQAILPTEVTGAIGSVKKSPSAEKKGNENSSATDPSSIPLLNRGEKN